jgi:Arc/MetJ-type ribon-helix-helix transcriptional regulator
MMTPTTGTGEERLTSLTESYRRLSEGNQRALESLAMMMREFEARHAEDVTRLEEKHAAAMSANTSLREENATMSREVESARAETAALHEELIALRDDHEILLEERQATKVLIEAFDEYTAKRQATDAAAKRAAARRDATSSVSCEIMSFERLNDQPSDSSMFTEAPDALIGIEARTEAGPGEATASSAMSDEETVFTLPTDLLESMDLLVDAGHFASRSAFARIALAEAIKARLTAAESRSSAGVRSVRRRKERVRGTASAPG